MAMENPQVPEIVRDEDFDYAPIIEEINHIVRAYQLPIGTAAIVLLIARIDTLAEGFSAVGKIGLGGLFGGLFGQPK